MIYTLTLSPCLDYFVDVSNFELGAVNRGFNPRLSVGGKGINVSRVLKSLGVSTTALLAYGGVNGRKIIAGLVAEGLSVIGFETAGESRINIKINSCEETAVNLPSPPLDGDSISVLAKTLDDVEEMSTLVISGTIGRIIPLDTLKSLLLKLRDRRVKLVFDISEKAVADLFSTEPFLIKPNIDELATIAGFSIESEADFYRALSALNQLGAQRIIVSLGSSGSFYYENRIEHFFIPTRAVKARSTVGAGDTLLAVFLREYLLSSDPREALTKASAYVAAKLEQS